MKVFQRDVDELLITLRASIHSRFITAKLRESLKELNKVYRNVLGKSAHLKGWLSKYLTLYIPRVLKIQILFFFFYCQRGWLHSSNLSTFVF